MNSDDRDCVQGFMITPAMLRVLLYEGATMRCMVGVPADAQFLDAYPDMASRSIVAVFRHPSFAPIPAGERLPISRRVSFEILHDPSGRYTSTLTERVGVDEMSVRPYDQ